VRGAVVLAGGEARRFGGVDKLFLRTGKGKTLIQEVIGRLSFLDEVVVVTSSQERAEEIGSLTGLPCFLDSYPGILGGVSSGLQHLLSREVLVVGGDMPLINRSVVEFLFSFLESYEAAVPTHPNGFIEPLHGVLRRIRASEVLSTMGTRRRKVRCLYERLRTAWVPVSQRQRYDPELESFTNINDIETARTVFPASFTSPAAARNSRSSSSRSARALTSSLPRR